MNAVEGEGRRLSEKVTVLDVVEFEKRTMAGEEKR